MHKYNNLFSNFSSACSIADPDMDTFILTGGIHGRKTKTSVFGKAGWIKDLADLNQGRYMHACASYFSNGKRVKDSKRLFSK